MALSRVRLRLTAGFAVAFLLGLGLLNTALYGFLRRQASQRLTARLEAAARELADAIRAEEGEAPAAGIGPAAAEALSEWPDPGISVLVADARGTAIGARGDTAELRLLPAPGALTFDGPRTIRHRGVRWVAIRDTRTPMIEVAAITTTAGLRTEEDTLLRWLGLSAPLVLILSLTAGYLLSRFALRPVDTLGRAVAALPPENLDQRLPVALPPDEIDHLALQFNDLLGRLHEMQGRNRQFLEAAAHQLRTPLTLVLGESQLGLEAGRSAEERTETLRRIQIAAQQMRHRVSDLFLLARAQAGDRPPLAEKVDLDGLVFEGADLFRARAQSLGRTLELGTMDAAEVRGDEMLLREAVMELLENACRHSDGEGPVRISVVARAGAAEITVENPGPPIPTGPVERTAAGTREPRGLGLALLRWIAGVHHGSLELAHADGRNTLALRLPLTQG
jgi:signal transduction histidine kinase